MKEESIKKLSTSGDKYIKYATVRPFAHSLYKLLEFSPREILKFHYS